MNYLMLLASAYLALINSRLGDIKLNENQWTAFKSEHGKVYSDELTHSMRRSIFAYNKHMIDEFNANQSERLGFELDVNHLADISEVEMKMRNGFRLPEHHLDSESGQLLTHNSDSAAAFVANILANTSAEVPDAVDWRKVPGRVSAVKNQGACGSCWAFASTGALEGQEVVHGKPAQVELSEQNLVDCVKKDYGCNGGFMKDALDFVKDEGGIDDEKSYPYEGIARPCRYKASKAAFADQGSAILPEGDEQKLKEMVAKFGPVAVAIDASSIWFQFYRKGVYYNKHCKNKADQLDHGVLVVGYGTDEKKGDYWIVKNSWGPGYGEHGYIRMARNRNNNCGIATVATIPTF